MTHYQTLRLEIDDGLATLTLCRRKICLVPDLGSSWLLPQAMGRARATGLMLLGESCRPKTPRPGG